jgi:hypothetical protein
MQCKGSSIVGADSRARDDARTCNALISGEILQDYRLVPGLGEREQEAVSFVGSSSCVGGPGGRPGGIWGEAHPKVSSAVRSNQSAITSTDQPQNATVLLENPSDFARRSSLS